jgi:hypothetical protein
MESMVFDLIVALSKEFLSVEQINHQTGTLQSIFSSGHSCFFLFSLAKKKNYVIRKSNTKFSFPGVGQ